MANEPEVIKADEQLDIAGLTSLVSSFIGPLAEQQAAVQKSAIDADLQKHRMTIELKSKTGQRSFHLALGLLLLSGGTLAALMLAGKYDLAVNVLWYLGGGISGYGAAIARKSAD